MTGKHRWIIVLAIGVTLMGATISRAQEKPARPNIIILFADDISAREFPTYESSQWTAPLAAKDKTQGHSTTNPAYRAKTPMLDRLAQQGAFVRTAWATPVCSPSRAMITTGRYAHLHKWWQNSDVGKYTDATGKRAAWPLYESSPRMIGHVARQGGYATLWVGKTQMKNSDLARFGFDSVITSPAVDLGKPGHNPHTDFRLARKKNAPKGIFVSLDTGKTYKAKWPETSFFWQPNIGTINWPPGTKGRRWWPHSRPDVIAFGLSTYGPDVEMQFALDHIDRQHAAGKPFFIYHTSHLGHAARNWINQPGKLWYPGTPKIKWDGKKYTRTRPRITGDQGQYSTHNTVTDPGIHHHINYLDYQLWQYLTKLEALGIADNTVIIFTADNGTLGHGKMRVEKQRGTHVPFYIHAPGMTRRGKLDILVDLSDVLPTVADLAGVELPDDYPINGKSLMPYLTGKTKAHRDWIYAWLFEKQMIRGHKVMRDGNGVWWNVEKDPADLDSYAKITDWSAVSEAHRQERDQLKQILPRFDKHASEHDAPQP